MASAALDGKVALVTGAASGIGRAISTGYAHHGARVVAVDLNDASGEGIALPIVADITRADQVERAVRQAVQEFGRLDVLVNNAAIQLHGRDGRCHEVPD